MFSLQQNQRTRGWNRLCPEAGVCGGEWEVVQTMYIHVRKCKNDKIKKYFTTSL
jgi:outer membrane phospholipase A